MICKELIEVNDFCVNHPRRKQVERFGHYHFRRTRHEAGFCDLCKPLIGKMALRPIEDCEEANCFGALVELPVSDHK